MKIFTTIMALSVTICLTGCFSMDISVTPDGDDHIVVGNYGWYLFDTLPIACGNAAHDRYTPWVLFRNDVTMDKIQYRFMKYRAERGKDSINLNYFNKKNVLFEIPGSQIPVPIPYLLTYREIQLSGVLR